MCITDLLQCCKCAEFTENLVRTKFTETIYPTLAFSKASWFIEFCSINASLPYFERMRHIGQLELLLLPLTRCECHELIIRCLTTIYVQYSSVFVHYTVQLSSVKYCKVLYCTIQYSTASVIIPKQYCITIVSIAVLCELYSTV